MAVFMKYFKQFSKAGWVGCISLVVQNPETDQSVLQICVEILQDVTLKATFEEFLQRLDSTFYKILKMAGWHLCYRACSFVLHSGLVGLGSLLCVFPRLCVRVRRM